MICSFYEYYVLVMAGHGFLHRFSCKGKDEPQAFTGARNKVRRVVAPVGARYELYRSSI